MSLTDPTGAKTDPSEGENNVPYLTVEDFERLNFPEKLPKYEGGGDTSYKADYDGDKMGYLTQLGLEVPQNWLAESGKIVPESRALFLTFFIATGAVLVMESKRRILASVLSQEDYENEFAKHVKNRTEALVEGRLDTKHYRTRTSLGGDDSAIPMDEELFRDLGLSSNAEKKVSEKELRFVIQLVLTELSKERKQ